jgi:hypothetical protein
METRHIRSLMAAYSICITIVSKASNRGASWTTNLEALYELLLFAVDRRLRETGTDFASVVEMLQAVWGIETRMQLEGVSDPVELAQLHSAALSSFHESCSGTSGSTKRDGSRQAAIMDEREADTAIMHAVANQYISPFLQSITSSRETAPNTVRTMSIKVASSSRGATSTVDAKSKMAQECKLCRICASQQVNVVLIPCRHVAVCLSCFEKKPPLNCPDCGVLVQSSMKVFI